MIDGALIAIRSPRRRKAAAWVVLSALLFNLAAGFVLPSSAQAALSELSAAGPAASLSGNIVICTPNGLRVIYIGPDGEPLPDQPQRDASCVYCLPFNTGQAGTVGAPVIETIPLTTVVRITYPASGLTSSSGGSLDTHPIRAPPVFQ